MALILCCIWSLIISDGVFKCIWSLFHHFMTLHGITSTDLPIRIYARADQRPRDYKSQTHAGYRLECRHPVLKCQMITKLSSSEDRMILAGVVLAWYRTVTDGQTDGRTESIIAKTALCIASIADALSKITLSQNMTARCAQYTSALKIVCKRKISRQSCKNRHITILSLFGGEIISKCSNQCDQGT